MPILASIKQAAAEKIKNISNNIAQRRETEMRIRKAINEKAGEAALKEREKQAIRVAVESEKAVGDRRVNAIRGNNQGLGSISNNVLFGTPMKNNQPRNVSKGKTKKIRVGNKIITIKNAGSRRPQIRQQQNNSPSVFGGFGGTQSSGKRFNPITGRYE